MPFGNCFQNFNWIRFLQGPEILCSLSGTGLYNTTGTLLRKSFNTKAGHDITVTNLSRRGFLVHSGSRKRVVTSGCRKTLMHTIPVDLPNECIPLAICIGCFVLAVDLHSAVRQYQPTAVQGQHWSEQMVDLFYDTFVERKHGIKSASHWHVWLKVPSMTSRFLCLQFCKSSHSLFHDLSPLESFGKVQASCSPFAGFASENDLLKPVITVL